MTEIKHTYPPNEKSKGNRGDIWTDTSSDLKYKLVSIINIQAGEDSVSYYNWVLIQGSKCSSKILNVTALAANWTGDDAPYSNTIAVQGVTEKNIVDVGASALASDEQLQEMTKAAILKIIQGVDSLTLYSYGTKPESDFPIAVIIRGDSAVGGDA